MTMDAPNRSRSKKTESAFDTLFVSVFSYPNRISHSSKLRLWTRIRAVCQEGGPERGGDPVGSIEALPDGAQVICGATFGSRPCSSELPWCKYCEPLLFGPD